MALVSVARDLVVAAGAKVATAPVPMAGNNAASISVTKTSNASTTLAVIPQGSIDGAYWQNLSTGTVDIFTFSSAEETKMSIIGAGGPDGDFDNPIGYVYFRLLLDNTGASAAIVSIDVNTFVA